MLLACAPASLQLLGLLARSAALWGETDVRSEARVEAGTEADPGAALQLDGHGEVSAGVPNASFTVSYAPQLLLGAGSEGTGLYNRGNVLGRLRLDRRLQVQVEAGAAYGVSDVSPLAQAQQAAAAGAPVTPLEPLPNNTVLEVMDLRGVANLRYQVSRRIIAEVNVLGEVRGGADAASRSELPVEDTLRAEATISYQWERDQTLITHVVEEEDQLASTGLATFDGGIGGGGQASMTELSEKWMGFTDRSSDLAFEAGAAWVDSEIAGETTKQLFPIVGAAYDIRYGNRAVVGTLDQSFTLRLSPYFDRLTGEVYQQIAGRVSLGYQAITSLRVEVVAGAAGPTVLPLDYRSLAIAEVRVDRRLGTRSHLIGGLRGLAGSAGVQAVLFVAFLIGTETGPQPGGAP